MGIGINTPTSTPATVGHTGHANHHRNGFGAAAGGRLMRDPTARRGALGAAGTVGGATQTAPLGGLSGAEPSVKGSVKKPYSETRAVTTSGFNFKNMGVAVYADGSYSFAGAPVCFGITIDGISGRISLSQEDIMRIFEESSEYRKAFDPGGGVYDNATLKEMAVAHFMKGDFAGPGGANTNFYVKKDGKLVKVDQAFIDGLVGHSYNQYSAADRKAVKDFFDGAELFTDKAKAVEGLAAGTAGKKYYVYNSESKTYDEVDRAFIDALKADGVDIEKYFADKVIYEENPLRKDAAREFARLINLQIEQQFGEDYKNIATATGGGEITFRKNGSQISLSFGREDIQTLEDAEPAADSAAELLEETLERWNGVEDERYAEFALLKTALSKLREQQEAWRFAGLEDGDVDF